MKIKQRMNSYPILSKITDDYINSSFETEINWYDAKKTRMKFDFKLDNETIQNLIKNGDAHYLVHMECPTTSFRQAYQSTQDEIIIELPQQNLNEKIEINTFIVAAKEIKEYTNPLFNMDFKDMKFYLSRGNMIAIGNAVEISIEDKYNENSIIRITKRNDDSLDALRVDTSKSEYIIISLPERLRDLYCNLGSGQFENICRSIIILPVMMVVLKTMQVAANDDDSSVTELHWYKVIESWLDNQGIDVKDIDFDNEGENSALAIAQIIFKNPIKNAFEELKNINS
ncbi:MAG: hypothetical protein Q4E39_06955 [bacterium]|nr:hypothetical protein [bacterium]